VKAADLPGGYVPSLPEPVETATRMSFGAATAGLNVNVQDNDNVGQQQQQAQQNNAARVPLPPQKKSISSGQASSPIGPMSAQVQIPPRPKPGRKPLQQEHAADRRRLQNRIAQRNFRDKRQQKLHETQQELEERKVEYQEEINDLHRQLDEMRRQNLELQRRLNSAENRIQDAEKKFQQSQLYGNRVSTGYPQTSMATTTASATFPLAINTNHRNIGAYNASVPTPPEDNTFGEIDFTNHFRNSQQQSANALTLSVSNDSNNAMDYAGGSMDIEDRCGFCTDDQNCACRNEQQAKQNANEASFAAAVPTNNVGSGNCDACRRDPARAQACREMAMGARSSTTEGPRFYENNGGMMGPPAGRTSCSSLVDHFRFRSFDSQRTPSIAELVPGQVVNVYPVVGNGYEIEEAQAAEALQTLSGSRRGTMASMPDQSGGFIGDGSQRHGL